MTFTALARPRLFLALISSERFTQRTLQLMTIASLCLALTTTASAQPAVVAAPTVLNYQGNGLEGGFLRYSATGTLRWTHDTSTYQTQLEVTALGMKLRSWASTGTLSAHGLQPDRFEDVTRGAKRVTQFLRDAGVIRFSEDTSDQPLQADAQDKLSALLQLGFLIGADPQHYAAGSTISFQAADGHNVEQWHFQVSAPAVLELPDGNINAIALTRLTSPEMDQQLQVWLAPSASYLPVRLRITEKNGSFIDLLWQKTQNPN